jgi:hypothetical protein
MHPLKKSSTRVRRLSRDMDPEVEDPKEYDRRISDRSPSTVNKLRRNRVSIKPIQVNPETVIIQKT